jgi:hypothetical protein
MEHCAMNEFPTHSKSDRGKCAQNLLRDEAYAVLTTKVEGCDFQMCQNLTILARGEICKTFIREFDSHPRLQQLSDKYQSNETVPRSTMVREVSPRSTKIGRKSGPSRTVFGPLSDGGIIRPWAQRAKSFDQSKRHG